MWYDAPIPTRAPRGGLTDPLNGLQYHGGQFLPFYVPRPIMPQIDEADYADFIGFCRARGCNVMRETVDPGEVRAHQRIDRIHADRMPPEVRAKPIFLSADSYVLDGNHRWLLHALEGSPISAFRLMRKFEPAIALMFEFPRTYCLSSHAERN